MANYWNEEDDSSIICPYCGKNYEPSYEDCYIGGKSINCYTTEEQECTCDGCGKRFTMIGYEVGWNYKTETIEGEATEEEAEDLLYSGREADDPVYAWIKKNGRQI